MSQSQGQIRNLHQMEHIAQDFCELIADSVERCLIVGSIRRKSPNPRDIDIVAIPMWLEEAKQETLFGNKMVVKKNLLSRKLDSLCKKGVISLREKSDGVTVSGQAVALFNYMDVPLDVYQASEQTWWGLVQMRTGPMELNVFLAKRALSLGLNYHGDGNGITKKGIRVDLNQNEASIFEALNLNYIDPEVRSNYVEEPV